MIGARGENPANLSFKKSGRFYRGFLPDLMDEDSYTKTIELSRNGLMQMLPEALFYHEEYLREGVTDADSLKEKKEDLKAQKQLCSVFFDGFDTVFARHELQLHNLVDGAERCKRELLLREIYGFDVAKERNPLIRKLAYWLLEGDTVKGNIPLLAFCVKVITGIVVSYKVSTQVMNDDRCFNRTMNGMRSRATRYRRVLFVLHIEGLSPKDYLDMMEQYEEFFAFLGDWFMPYDCEVDYKIKDFRQPFVLGEPLTLDYNTQFLA